LHSSKSASNIIVADRFYGDLAHGLKFHNTFHLSTPDASYTCDATPTINNFSHFKEIRRAWNGERRTGFDTCACAMTIG